ncbi:hypothetical protein [Agrobacterium larrymoorei]|uniref:2OG-Fe(II) oxygenase n=1 Tax=Agrobacterium larrymoorei TaxID=160699 RepID=A0A4D7DVA0_9HYPH|nr:hypothetical protein [Agrobacterium larrymoorei]QCI98489.1 hypothetical protein CFBP5473_11640 [Agrobacterium larrymoorei]QYA06048.1 hypothetical protein J5285_08090 [Agrobacterium larrymoorei]
MIRSKEIHYDCNQPHHFAEAIGQIINDELDVLWLRGFVPVEKCDLVARNFYGSEAAKPRADNVPGIMIGESHYFKDPEYYYQRCQDTLEDVENLFHGQRSPVRQFYSHIAEGLNIEVRPATYKSKEALHTRAIEWQDKADGDFLLQPHDDVSQVFCERNQDWEITEIKTLVAINYYAKCEAGQGILRVFDLKHSSDVAEEIGLECKGYPYPPHLLENAQVLDVPVKTGDIVVINGALIHGVLKSKSGRIVLNSFLGDLDAKEFIYWT